MADLILYFGILDFMIIAFTVVGATLLMSAVMLIAGTLPRWVGVVMLVSMLLAAILPLGTLGPPAILLNLLLATGPITFGYALWTELGESKETMITSFTEPAQAGKKVGNSNGA